MPGAGRWWCRTLGFELVESSDGQHASRSHLLLRHPESGLVLRLRRGTPATGRPRYLSLRVESEQALRDWAAHLRRRGIPHSPPRDNGLEQWVSLTGPDDMRIELWWPRPPRAEPAAQHGAAQHGAAQHGAAQHGAGQQRAARHWAGEPGRRA